MIWQPRSAAAFKRRKRTGNSSLTSGPIIKTTSPAQASSIVAPGKVSTTAGSTPSPSWASTLSVPTTPLANLAHAYASSFVPRAPPSTATEPGPRLVRASRIRSATSDKASAQDIDSNWRDVPGIRRSGLKTRSSASKASCVKRPLSQSQPWFTASESRPSTRATRSPELCTVVRHPTAQVVHVESLSSKSHGRARNRYGLAKSAPTGHSSTVLPEK